MNATADIPSTRFAALEERLARLEFELEALRDEILPWHVICAAVAAVMPDVRVVRVHPIRDEGWKSVGRLRHLTSHEIR